MNVGAAQGFRVDLLAGRRPHQRRAAEKHAPLIAHDDGVIGHGGHIGAARGAGAVHHGDLRDALRREPRLIEEYAAEVLAVGKYLVLPRQEGAAALDQVDAGQRVVAGDLLRPQMLLHGERIVGAALHRGIVRHHHAFAARDPADAGNEARPRQILAVHALRRQRRQLQEGRSGIQQRGDALARQQLARLGVLVARGRAAARRIAPQRGAQILDQRLHGGAVVGEFLRAGIDFRS